MTKLTDPRVVEEAMVRLAILTAQSVRVPEKDPGDHYANKEREASVYQEFLDKARELRSSSATIKRLERLLDMARYTGD